MCCDNPAQPESSWGGQGPALSQPSPAQSRPHCPSLGTSLGCHSTGSCRAGAGFECCPSAAGPGSCCTSPHLAAAPARFLCSFPVDFTQKCCHALSPHHLMENHCHSLSLAVNSAAAELWAREPSVGLETCVQKTGGTNVGIPPWEAGGKSCQFLSAISCQGHEQQILIFSRTFRHQPE